MTSPIANRVAVISETIRRSALTSGRSEADVTSIVVTKNRTHEEIQEMYRLGFRHFAENRVERLLERQAAFPQADIVWHLIGPLQKRKVKAVINQIDYFHALDRLSIASEIEKRLEHPLKCFLQVNVSGEVSKHGFAPTEVVEAMESIQPLQNIQIIGLMTMAPFSVGAQEVEAVFVQLARLATNLESQFQLAEPLQLSMGMSRDYPIAIHHGATHVRIGTAWFEV